MAEKLLCLVAIREALCTWMGSFLGAICSMQPSKNFLLNYYLYYTNT